MLNYDDSESRRAIEHCYRTTSTMLNPILDWTDEEVWTFLKFYGCEGNPLYQCGSHRVGCIGCPFANKKNRIAELEAYPKYKEAYQRAFDRMLDEIQARGAKTELSWRNGEDVMRWWLEEEYDPNQLSLFDVEGND